MQATRPILTAKSSEVISALTPALVFDLNLLHVGRHKVPLAKKKSSRHVILVNCLMASKLSTV